MLKQFTSYLRLYEALEGGSSPGRLDITKITLDEAFRFASQEFAKHDKILEKLFPNFKINFLAAQQKIKLGSTKRKDMPVIRQKDIKALQSILLRGGISLNKEYHRGKKKIHFSLQKVAVSSLTPIQDQVFFDKVIEAAARETRSETLTFLRNTIFVVSSDHRIVDGHHRFLSAMLINQNMKVPVLSVDLPIGELLPMMLKFSDQRNNVRNF